ncbi:MAG: hypothetical protein FJ221_13545 [Lentisphaerae bacterium]|nr:hypothetical protein [Lentisphaerota bacterium]
MERPVELARMEEGAGITRAGVHLAVGVFFVVGALLNGENLLATAETMEHGSPARTVCVAAARPLAAAARALHLGAPRRAIEAWVDRISAP